MRYLFIKDVLPLPSSPITRTLNKESFSVNFGLFLNYYPPPSYKFPKQKTLKMYSALSALIAPPSKWRSVIVKSLLNLHTDAHGMKDSEIRKRLKRFVDVSLHTETQVTAEERAVCNAISRDLQRCQRLEIGGNRRIRNTWHRAFAEPVTHLFNKVTSFDFQTNLLRNVQYVER